MNGREVSSSVIDQNEVSRRKWIHSIDRGREIDVERVSNKKKVDAESLEAYEVIFSRVWFCIWLVMLFKAIAAAIHLFQRGAAGHQIDPQRALNQWRCNTSSMAIAMASGAILHAARTLRLRFIFVSVHSIQFYSIHCARAQRRIGTSEWIFTQYGRPSNARI